jgi:homoserine O-succinyltransferase/O-acetyltransferase
MALLIEGGRIPPRWAEKRAGKNDGDRSNPRASYGAEYVRIAFINNMPDSALEDTEMQFLELIESAAGDTPVRLKFFSLPNVPRSDRGKQHLNSFYHGIEDLFRSGCDALIMTGTEPMHSDLRQEPYWHALTDVLDWAERNTASTILSCLAAHAGVLYGDGVQRHRLPDKKFGVFDSDGVRDHELTHHATRPVRFPHSRWNEVREDELVSAGYSVLTRSAHAGVDSFLKQKRKSLFLHFQGHPEYGSSTLLKEYRRDIKRFLRQERSTYPAMPEGYLDTLSVKLLSEFRETALAHPGEARMVVFPEALLAGALQNTWQASAACVYRNWLQYVISRKNDRIAMVPVAGREVAHNALAGPDLA